MESKERIMETLKGQGEQWTNTMGERRFRSPMLHEVLLTGGTSACYDLHIRIYVYD
jgi:hypothetical protein